MNSKEIILAALSHTEPPRLPLDLGAMGSSGISAFAYPGLRKALGLEERPPIIFDSYQMLALPEPDVLDELGCDVVFSDLNINSYSDFADWKEFDFAGRLTGLVPPDTKFKAESDGSVSQLDKEGNIILTMPPGACFFDPPPAKGEENNFLSGDLKYVNLEELKYSFGEISDSSLANLIKEAEILRQKTDRAIMFNPGLPCLGFPTGVANWCMMLLMDPDHVSKVFEVITENTVKTIKRMGPSLSGKIDIITVASDDQGTQRGPYINPELFKELYVPFYRRINDAWHNAVPGIKTFFHSCGSVYPLLPYFISAGFDIYNPVQWSAENMAPREIKKNYGEKLCFWGGGVDTQHTLPLKSIKEIKNEVKMVVETFGEGGGYVFCAIHNLTAEIPPEKIIAIYETAKNY